MTATVVIVGCGYGGATVAKALDEIAEVIVVEPRDTFAHNVAALRATVDPRWSDRMFLPYDAFLARGRVVRDHAERVEPSAVVQRSGERLEADFIVLATGSTYPFPAKIGLTGTTDAKNHLHRTREALEAAHSVLLLGAGPVGLEFAGEIKAAWPRKKITLVDPRERILDGMPEEMGVEVGRQLVEMNVELILGTSLLQEPPSEPGHHKTFTAALASGIEVTADIWFRCFGAAPVTGYLGDELTTARQPSGLLEVQATLQLAGQETVFALGDITSIPEPKKAKAAEEHGAVIAANIQALIEGGAELATYRTGAPMMALSLGPAAGASYTPATGLLGPEATARVKSADLRAEFYEQLFGLSRPNTLAKG
ncbi:MAG: NAD(P)/FAD-dependent oxidoreductase [Frankia sp.]